jgi:hypothetical protein
VSPESDLANRGQAEQNFTMPAKRCPMCHQANEDRAWSCRRCAYEFGQPVEKVLELLRGQLRSQTIIVLVLLALLGGLVAAIVFRIPVATSVAILTLVMNASWLARASHKLALTRSSLRSLSARHHELPKAVVVPATTTERARSERAGT